MLDAKSVHAATCFAGGFIGVEEDIPGDLTADLTEDWRVFNKKFIPVYLSKFAGKTKIAAGLACGFTWTVSKGIQVGDLVLCPDGFGAYKVGEVTSEYVYAPDAVLPHRRHVKWLSQTINRADMSEALKRSAASGTVCNISEYQEEIERLIGGTASAIIVSTDPSVEDPVTFALEKHLEDFLIQNWAQTELGKEYDIYEEEGEMVGQQYPTDTGPVDILAISKDKKRLLVVELKKGRASDAVVGQVLRYMGFVQEELSEEGQTVSGVIIASEDDQRIRRALAIVPSIAFYRYQVSFRLLKG